MNILTRFLETLNKISSRRRVLRRAKILAQAEVTEDRETRRRRLERETRHPVLYL